VKTCSTCLAEDLCECTMFPCSAGTDTSDNNDEMDDYIEAQLDKKKTQKAEDGGSVSGGETDGPTPSLAMKGTKLE
jgi:hypothetical protein